METILTIPAASWQLEQDNFKGSVHFKNRAEHSTWLAAGPKLIVVNESDEIYFGGAFTMWKDVGFQLGERTALLRYRATRWDVGVSLIVDGDIIEAVERERCKTAEQVTMQAGFYLLLALIAVVLTALSY